MATIRQLRIAEAQSILRELGLPKEQQNERAALTLLALLGLGPGDPWHDAQAPLLGVTPIMEFARKEYRKSWKPNTRETVRRFTLHQFVQAGLAIPNPDSPERPINSPNYCYQIDDRALQLIAKRGTPEWELALRLYLGEVGTLAERYSQRRDMRRIPLALRPGTVITLSPGGQNVLVKQIMEEFCPRFTPGALPVYVGDADTKWAYCEVEYLDKLGVQVESHGKMPDVVVHFTERNWLVLIEAVTSHGPISAKRLAELKELFSNSSAGLVFVTAFLDRATLNRHLPEIAWETEVWVAESPGHMIHFNGSRFLGPYAAEVELDP